jgi:hypothetical protein
MTLTIGIWIIPLMLTIGILGIACRPYQRQGDYDPGPVERAAWIVPILLIWMAFLAYGWLVAAS